MPASPQPLSPSVRDDPALAWLNDLLIYAHTQGVSDIHLEPQGQGLRVRCRIDGLLQAYASPDVNWRDRLVSRIKVLSRMDIAEKRLPQDGRVHWQLPPVHGSPAVQLHVRVSSLPTLHGEKLVLRLLPMLTQPKALHELGFTSLQLQALQQALASPHGLILVTGPTGSGKSATLMACLQSLNGQGLNITTVEDPVEQTLAHINQVSVNDKIGFDFATALRALLRQDPDVLMVGEIRDLATAMVATQAAQTGHLVLSTLHTNSAAAASARLRHMGVPADHLAASLRLVCAQRLVRALCPHCKQADALLGWQAQGCDQCRQGYRGRVALHEVLPMTNDLLALVLADADPVRIGQCAKEQGVVSLAQHGQALVDAGQTSAAEVWLACQTQA